MNATETHTIRVFWYEELRSNVCKLAGVYVGSLRAAVIRQEVDVETLQWGQPTVTVLQTERVTPEFARAYAAALTRAVEIAEAWGRGERAEGEV